MEIRPERLLRLLACVPIGVLGDELSAAWSVARGAAWPAQPTQG